LLSPPADNANVSVRIQTLSVSASDNLALDNITLFVYNVTDDLINETTVFNYSTSAIVSVVFEFPDDGNFSWGYRATDTAGNSQYTVNRSIFVDATALLINFTSPTLDNNTEVEANAIFVNISLGGGHFANVTYELYNETGGSTLVNSSFYSTQILTINWTNLNSANVTYFYRAFAYDTFVNLNSTEYRTIKLLDNTGPIITIEEPQNGKTYTNNVSMELNVSVIDFGAAPESCFWNIDDGTNNTITCGQNTTFNTTDGEHTLNFFANDSLGNFASASSDFRVSIFGPAITLTFPADGANLSVPGEIFFNYTAEDPNSVSACTLFGNWSDGWHANETKGMEWWHTSWVYRQDINISNVGSTVLTSFPVYVDVLFDSNMRSDYQDLRFINGSCGDSNAASQVLDYEFEFFNVTKADVWLRIPFLLTGNTSVCVYYGNAEAGNGENVSGVWNSGYTSVYHLNHTSGTAFDELGNFDAGEFIGPDSNMDNIGVVGRSDFFDGNDYLGNNPEWNVDGAHTYCAWVRYNTAHDGTINEDGGNNDGTGMAILSTGAVRYGERFNNAQNNIDSTGTNYANNEWHYVCGGHEGGGGAQFLFVDGVENIRVIQGDGISGGGDARIASGNGANPPFGDSSSHFLNDVYLDEFRVSNTDRSADWLNQSFYICKV